MAETASAVLGEAESLTKDPKAQFDFSAQAETLIGKCRELAKAGRLEDALEELQQLEKKCRQQSDGASASRLCCCYLELLFEAKAWSRANEAILSLTRKRGQLKRCQVDIARLGMAHIEKTPNYDTKIALIQTLIQVTEGKIFAEVERARVVKMLAEIRESEGKLNEAATLLQEVQVETFGAMEKREKVEYILEQMRVVLACKEFVRCGIISKKLSSRALEDPELNDLKLRYYSLLVQMYVEETRSGSVDGDIKAIGGGGRLASNIDQSRLMDIAAAYNAMLRTPSVEVGGEQYNSYLAEYLVFVMLSPLSEERTGMLSKASSEFRKALENLPATRWLLESFLRVEMLDWPLVQEDQVKRLSSFSSSNAEDAKARWQLLQKRVVQHNIKVLSAYYSQMRLSRVAEFLALDSDTAEAEVAELISSGSVQGRIDRISGVLRFGSQARDPGEVLDAWGSRIRDMLDLVEETAHLIFKERMIKQARDRQAQQKQKSAAAKA